MEIKDLQPRTGDVDVVLEIVDKGDVREFEKFGTKGRVCTVKAKDATGEINLSLWNEQIDPVNVGDKVHITNGYVSEFQGEAQLTTGKFGQLEVVGKGETKEEAPAEKPAETPAEKPDEPAAEEQGVSVEEEKVE